MVTSRERSSELEWVRPPQQARSQQTLERLLDAAEALIDEGGLDSATVAQIAKRAGSSVGSFYARFADRDALVHCVFERFHEQAMATARVVLTPGRWAGVDIGQALESMLLFMLRVLRERQQLIVALLVHAAYDPELSALGERLHQYITEYLNDMIEERDETVDHPNPEMAVGLCVWMVLSSLEIRFLYSTGGAVGREPDDVIAAEMARMCVRYLGLDSAHRSLQDSRRAAATDAPS